MIGKIGLAARRYRHFKRYRRILAVLLKYGFGELVYRITALQYAELGLQIFSRRRIESLEMLSRAERIRLALEELGPTFVKMGQILSTRPDLIPVEFIGELSKLQDSVPPFPFAQAKKIVETELKQPLEAVFLSFAEEPLAAASIGQVHRAKLYTGEDVVVKVQRPGVRRLIEIDLALLLYLAQLAEKHVEEMKHYRPTGIVREFARSIAREMDYTVEAAHQERFARQFLGNPTIYVPRIFREVSTGRVLTMEYVDGIKVSETARLDEAGFDRKRIAARGADLLLEQVFKFGFFHADPHPGNIFILRDHVICYLDFGMMGSVDRRAKEDFVGLAEGYVGRDAAKTVDSLLRLTEWEIEPDRRALEKDVAEYTELHLYKPLKEWRIRDLIQGMMEIVAKHELRIPPDVYLMIKAFSEVEGLGLMLDRDFDLLDRARPFIRRVKLERLSPERLYEEIAGSGSELAGFIRETPGLLRDIFNQVKQGKTRIGFEHRGLERFISEMDRSSNRIAFSLIVSSLIIGSSLIMTTEIGPLLFGFPMLGIVGYCIAGIFGIWLVVSIFRSGKLRE